MRAKVGAATDVGRIRRLNEDSYLVRDPLFAVADGMGGHQGGEVASSLALEGLKTIDLEQQAIDEHLVEEIRQANRRVLEKGDADPALHGMGTTLTLMISLGDKAHVLHVGDTRAYLLRGGTLQQLTEDHTLVQRMVREGKLSPGEAERHPQRSILTRALGVDEELPVDELTLPILPGDRVLLCSDGLSGMVVDPRIQRILEEEADPQVAADRLVEEANRAGGDDNITAVVVDFEDDGPADASAQGQASTAVAAEERRAQERRAEERRAEDRRAQDRRSEEAAAERLAVEDPVATGTVLSSAHPPDVTSAPEGVDLTGVMAPVREPEPPRDGPEAPDEGRPPRRRVRWGRVIAWVAGLLVVLAIAGAGAWFYVTSQWYVGVAGDEVAIYNGIPTQIGSFELSRVEERSGLPAVDAMQLEPWTDLAEGITADSLEDARSVVEQIRADLEAGS